MYLFIYLLFYFYCCNFTSKNRFLSLCCYKMRFKKRIYVFDVFGEYFIENERRVVYRVDIKEFKIWTNNQKRFLQKLKSYAL